MLVGPALGGTGQRLRRPVASHPQRGRVQAQPGGALSLRRQSSAGLRAGNRAVLREHHPRRSQRAGSAGRRLHVPERAAGQALRDSRRIRRTIPAGPAAAGQRPSRAAGAGLDSDGHLARQPDVAGDSRQMDPREYFRRAAAVAACERARPEGRTGPVEDSADAGADGAAPRQSWLRELPCADGRAGVRARELRRDRRVARPRCRGRAD